ncbi:hypothetical protein E4U22_006526 [Claviceps purpurea]|nr:hypothetical protein E4U37_007388 [Claviceps purpurea]KAG6197099.1 hypothetical protein E4U50_007991 [Claviceps purpurea]KAG6317080.1 hypothetical protein E4U22_006526 [Claviceps purpurea]
MVLLSSSAPRLGPQTAVNDRAARARHERKTSLYLFGSASKWLLRQAVKTKRWTNPSISNHWNMIGRQKSIVNGETVRLATLQPERWLATNDLFECYFTDSPLEWVACGVV